MTTKRVWLAIAAGTLVIAAPFAAIFAAFWALDVLWKIFVPDITPDMSRALSFMVLGIVSVGAVIGMSSFYDDGDRRWGGD